LAANPHQASPDSHVDCGGFVHMISVGVTGATGFLGSYLCRRLPDLGAFRLRGLTRTLALEPKPTSTAVAWMQGDLNQPTDCAEFVRGLEVVIHLAHTNTPLTSNNYLPADAEANLLPTLNLIEAIRAVGTRPHVVFASSGGGVYSPLPEPRPLREEDPCMPATSYGIQKIAAELYLQMAAASGWLTATSLRISNPYGLLLPIQRRQGFVGVAVHRVLRGEPVHIFGNPDNVRDYIHLDDVARAVASTICETVPYRTYNIGSGKGLSVREVIGAIETILGHAIDVSYEPLGMAEHLTPWNVLDITRATRELRWQPNIVFADGLRSLLQNSAI
jgi:UDP-glucose 4-epimerase